MKTRYFVVMYHSQVYGLFRSNHDGAIKLQIDQLLKVPDMVVKEVGEIQYKQAQAERLAQ